MIPTDYQRGLYAMFTELMKEIDPSVQVLDIDTLPDNGDGRDNLVLHMGTMFTITIPPTGDQPLSLPMAAFRLRADIRAIMRAGGEVPADIAKRSWWPEDLIREVTEWHDAGRPDAATTVARIRADNHSFDLPYHPNTEPEGRTLYRYTEADVKRAVWQWLSEEDENDDDPDLTNPDVFARFNRLVAAMTDWVKKNNGPPHPDIYFLLVASLDKTPQAVVN